MTHDIGHNPKELLKRFKLKVTPIRVAVLEVLEKANHPLGISEIHKILEVSGANYVSVYRTMLAFAESGIIRTVNLRHGHTDYELVGTVDHHHIVCVGCGKIEEFDDCGMDSLVKKVLKQNTSFKTVTDHALELFGTCNICATV
jgi:Fur family transcriptional regulator, ferric uptake regulator